MRLKIISLISAVILLSACGSNTDGTYSTNGYGLSSNGNGSSKNNKPIVPESVLPVNVSKAPKGPAPYAIFENLNHPQDIQNSKENFTKAQLSSQLQQHVYSSPEASTTTKSGVAQ